MRKLVALLAVASCIAATQAYAQSSESAPGQGVQSSAQNSSQTWNGDSLLLDGQDAMAQVPPGGDNPPPVSLGPNGLIIGGVVAGVVGGVVFAISQNNSHSVSP